MTALITKRELGEKRLDAFSILLTIFIVFILFIGALFVLAIFSAIFRKSKAQPNYSSSNQESSSSSNQTDKDSSEDSEGDGLMLFDDPMFPPEFDDDDT